MSNTSASNIFDLSTSGSSITSLDLSNKRTYLPIESYIPEDLRDNGFFKAISIMIDYLENSIKDYSNPKYAMIEQAYRDLGFKYKDIMQLSESALKEMLIENGFGAILDMLELPMEKLQMLVLYLPLFKALKGTDVGFKTLLDLIAYDFVLEDWLDNPTELEEHTYNIVFITFLNTGFDSRIVSKFIKFSRTYVYPTLKSIVVRCMYSKLAPAVYGRPIITKALKIKCFDEPKP